LLGIGHSTGSKTSCSEKSHCAGSNSAVLCGACFLRRNRRASTGVQQYWTLVQNRAPANGPTPRDWSPRWAGARAGKPNPTRLEQMGDLLEGRAPARSKVSWAKAYRHPAGAMGAGGFAAGYGSSACGSSGKFTWRSPCGGGWGLHTLLKEIIPPGEEDVPWELTACILTVARFCGQRSELEVASAGMADSAWKICWACHSPNQRRSALSRTGRAAGAQGSTLHPSLETLPGLVWGGVEFLLYDVTSTYFEGQALDNEKAARVTPGIIDRTANSQYRLGRDAGGFADRL